MNSSEAKGTKKNNIIIVIYILLAVVAFFACVKCIFVGIQRDEEYAITLSYRLIHGDRLLANVWDPHQTSAFLVSALEWIFIKVTGGTKFLIIWLRICGSLIHTAISVYLYKTLKNYVNKGTAYVLSIIFFAILPKGYILPEFSLMMSWFTTLLVLVFINMRRREFKGYDVKNLLGMILMSVTMCMLVLSYPSCALVFPVVLLLLIVDRANLPKLCWLIFTVVCVLIGCLYMAYLLSYMSIADIIFNARSVISSCGSHGESNLSVYASNIVVMLVLSLIEFAVASLGVIIWNLTHKKNPFKNLSVNLKITLIISLIIATVGQVVYWVTTFTKYDWEYDYSYIFVILIFAGALLVLHTRNGRKENSDYFVVELINIVGFISVIILTNLNLFTSVQYITSGIIFALVVIVIYCQDSKFLKGLVTGFLILMAFSLNFTKGISYNSDDGELINITKIAKLVRQTDPGMGCVTEYMKGYMLDSTKEEWDMYIKDGDCILVWDELSLPYMNKDVTIGSYTTISTPTYDMESIMNYWDRNPDRFPNVIAVSCWYGELHVEESEEFYQWIANDYGATLVYDGKYYRYFIR